MTFWPLTNSDFSTDRTFHQFHNLYTELDLHRIMNGFHGAFATGMASQQGTLTLSDTWFRPPFWDLLVLQLLRPDSSNLVMSLLDFSPWIPLGIFSILLKVKREKKGYDSFILQKPLHLKKNSKSNMVTLINIDLTSTFWQKPQNPQKNPKSNVTTLITKDQLRYQRHWISLKSDGLGIYCIWSSFSECLLTVGRGRLHIV